MPQIELVADRFVVEASGGVVDLSTGDQVALIVSVAGGTSEQARWSARCDRFAGLHHRHIAPLVDFGLVGEVHRFEAWACGGGWTGEQRDAENAVERATSFLRSSGLDDGRLDATSVRVYEGRAVVVPNARAGYVAADIDTGHRGVDGVGAGATKVNGADLAPPPDVYGVGTASDRGVESIAESLSHTGDCRPTVLGLNGSGGDDVEDAVRLLARTARINGYIPVSASLISRIRRGRDPLATLMPFFERRTLFLIVRDDAMGAWRRLVLLVNQTPKPHVVLWIGVRDIPRIPTVALHRYASDRLRELLRPAPLDVAVRKRAASAALRSRGLPQRFRELFWGITPYRPHHRHPALRASEQAAVYGADAPAVPRERDERAGASEETPGQTGELPVGTELVVLRRRMADAIQQLAQGRHASGERATRRLVGALSRRGDFLHAASGGVALMGALVKRGRLREVRALLVQVQDLAERSRQTDVLLDISVLLGSVAIAETRLDEAETVLQAAVMSARGVEERRCINASGLALARCLFWSGRFDESENVLCDLESAGMSTLDAVQQETYRSRAAVGLGHLAEAITRAATARRLAHRHDVPAELALAACASAFAHLSVGDYAAVESDVAECRKASKLARDPLLALRARLLGVEALRRSGDASRAGALMRQLRRAASWQLPPIIRARYVLAADLLAGGRSDEIVRRLSASGLRGLRLFAPVSTDRAASPDNTAELVEILRWCQTSDDEADVLAGLCQRLRLKTRALGVAIFAEERGTFVGLASDGARIDPTIAVRVSAAAQTLGPSRMDERVEGGVPVRYGGRLIGALVARWPLAATIDGGSVSMLLATAATAAAPALAGLMVRRSERSAPWELLGGSRAIEDVRQVVARAAVAPFPVLIEGESGSGKELVARALHRRGPRRDRPYCAVNCAALPDDLVESELFGHARGAFTGAVAERPGVFEEAHTGTLFLDEIGELSLRAQAKVLRTIQESEVRRVGENVARRVDVRLVVATNRTLQNEVSAGRFRVDLLYRLDVIRIAVPALRDRQEDIAILAEHFWHEATARIGSKAVLSTTTLAALARYHWPGNVRELQNVLAALAVRSPKRGVVPPSALPRNVAGGVPAKSWRLVEARRSFEDNFVRAALVRSGGHRGRAAAELGVTRQGLTKLMTRLGIDDSL
jgi:DNA-binding NtrC family response regulator